MHRLIIVLIALPLCALAQRADDNAVQSADDAFGNSVGNEDVGLYNPFEVRGFSAIDAGNVRLDGLYFDRQTNPTNLLVPSSTMRVGISAQGYLLPAPTGIVDYRLARAGDELRVSPVLRYGPLGSVGAEVEFEAPLIADELGLAGGAAVFEDSYESGSDERGWAIAVAPRWRPNDALEIIPFYSRVETEDGEAQPLIFVSGPHLPPEVERDHFYGQEWADNAGAGTNYGAVVNATLASGWGVNAGVFRSQYESDASYADLFLNTSAEGLADHLMIADPPQKFGSTSGELRVSKRIEESVRRHTFFLSLRARDQQRRYGGSDVADFGVARIGVAVAHPEPDFQFGPQTDDEVKQSTYALAYQGQWARVGELSLGLQKTNYEKKVTAPGQSTQFGEDDPWLYNVGLALHSNEQLAWYGSYTTGLEEGGVAPENATNKNHAPPAIRTKQWDAGARYAFTPALRLVAGVFDIEKPYFSLDSNSVYRELGQQRHRGVEFSIAGQATKNLNVVVGAMFLEPRVSGEEVDSGAIGEIPVAQVRRLIIASADYRLPVLPALSFDATLTSISERMASTDNQLAIPARSVVDVGARWRFRIGRAPATLRLHVGNITDEFGWRTNTSSVFVTNGPRRYSLSLAADFPGG